jgi:hypothetical protein
LRSYRNKYFSTLEQFAVNASFTPQFKLFIEGVYTKITQQNILSLAYTTGTEATFLWYNLAAMQSPAATTASQKGHWNAADMRTLMVTPEAKGTGSVLVVDPIKGTLKLNAA